MNSEATILQYAKRFYFIEYYALLLGAIDKFSALSQAQTEFIYQKNLNYLGLSRYRKISTNVDEGVLIKVKINTNIHFLKYYWNVKILICYTRIKIQKKSL